MTRAVKEIRKQRRKVETPASGADDCSVRRRHFQYLSHAAAPAIFKKSSSSGVKLRPHSLRYAAWQTSLFHKSRKERNQCSMSNSGDSTDFHENGMFVRSFSPALLSPSKFRQCYLHELTTVSQTPNVASQLCIMGDDAHGPDLLHRLTMLEDDCRAAPRFGKNARELVLEAAASIEDDYEFQETPLETEKAVDPRSIPPTLEQRKEATEKPPMSEKELYEALPPKERPFVKYLAVRQKVPRFRRQKTVDRLTSEYLILMLKRMGLTSREQWKREIACNEEVRRLAVESADKHERDVYRMSYDERMYLKLMRTEHGSEKYIDVYWLKTSLSRNASMSSSTGEITIRHCLPNINKETTLEPIQESENQVEATEGRAIAASKKHVSFDIDLENKISSSPPLKDVRRKNKRCLDSTKKRQRLDPTTKNEETDESTPDKTPSKRDSPGRLPTDVDGKMPLDASRESRTDAGNSICKSRSNDTDTSMHPTSEETTPKKQIKDIEKIKHDAVLAAVRSILDPYLSAEVIDRDAFKKIAQKAVCKILTRHAEAKSVNFLVDELETIKAFVRSYIKFYKHTS